MPAVKSGLVTEIMSSVRFGDGEMARKYICVNCGKSRFVTHSTKKHKICGRCLRLQGGVKRS
jgi:ribosomal protein S27AE